MKRILLITTILSSVIIAATSQTKNPKDTEVWTPVPKIVSPALNSLSAPADAIVLFNGKNLDQWNTVKDGNGVLIQNNIELKGETVYIGAPFYKKHGPTPVKLQDHGDPSQPISFRNI